MHFSSGCNESQANINLQVEEHKFLRPVCFDNKCLDINIIRRLVHAFTQRIGYINYAFSSEAYLEPSRTSA